LQALLADLGPISQPSIIIGACEDGLPVVIDLAHSRAGSILILSGPRSGKTALLLSILTSTCQINTPRKARFACLSSKLQEFEPVLAEPHCYRFSVPYESQAAEIVHELADLASQRKLGKGLGPAILLGIDDLDECLGSLNEEDGQRLIWLIKEGPASQVWTLATLDTSRAGRQSQSLADFFGTWLIGQIEPAHQQFLSSRIHEARPEQLICGAQFCVLFENEWIRFWIPSA
jgi:hypothetical protein